MINWAQVTVAGLSTGTIYALLLFGVLIVFRVSRAVNFAHGQLGMIAAFGSYFLYTQAGLPTAVAIGLGLLSAMLVSYLTNVALIEPLTTRTSVAGIDLIVTLGVMVMLAAAAEQYFGNNTYSYLDLGNNIQMFPESGLFVSANQVIVLLIGIALFAGFTWFLTRTPAGAAMRASAADRDLAVSMGVNVRRIRGLTWAFAGLVAGIVGIIVASRLSVDAYYMTPFLIKAFIAGIVGGLDRFVTPLLLAVGLGIYEAWAGFVIGAQYGTPAVFLAVLLILAVLPKKFLDERREVRA